MWILIILSVVFGLIGWLSRRSLLNPILVFSLLWAVIFFMYEENLMGYYDITGKTKIIYFCQMLGFYIGGTIALFLHIRLKDNSNSGEILNDRLLYLLSYLTIALLALDSISMIIEFLKGNIHFFGEAKDLVTENSVDGVRLFLKYFLVEPFSKAISPICATELLYKNKRRIKKIIILNAVIVVLYTMRHGGRNVLILTILSYLFAFIFNRKNVMSKKTKRAFALIFSLGIIFTIWITSSRGISDFGEHIYYYLSGTVPHLDHYVNIISPNDFCFGLIFLYGLFDIIVFLLEGFGVVAKLPGFLEMADKFVAYPKSTVMIGSSVDMNAHIGISYYFYCDGGIIFVFLGCFVLGLIICGMFDKLSDNCKPRYFATYLFLFYMLCMSFIKLYTTEASYLIAFVYIFILYSGRKDSLGIVIAEYVDSE